MTELEIRDYFTDEMFLWMRQVIGPGDAVLRDFNYQKNGWGKHVWELELGKLYNVLRFKNEADALVYILRWK